MALLLISADVPLINYSLTHSSAGGSTNQLQYVVCSTAQSMTWKSLYVILEFPAVSRQTRAVTFHIQKPSKDTILLVGLSYPFVPLTWPYSVYKLHTSALCKSFTYLPTI